ncbi:hypothetical protein BBO99_00009371 [Phytophthora kernoviae]|uniref:Selenoprotein T n=3 Tax=Phytophthora kernoviae TaxID=325452 RepID=A0A3R7JXF5_9STRA|nr:hypothetical protein G195_010745 [Phytophthora kernoviae 00238/432]RLN31519.1 hypothetical protein BBI17_009386 [Phytophthora kernoviae]RLN73523.1 hypothetical protein BBO99_00009371 [Phytophthora kernoviae]
MTRMTLVLRVLLLTVGLIALYGTCTSSVTKPSESVFDAAAKSEEDAATKERNLQRNIADDEVRVLYCTACGYEANFNQVKKYVEDTFPHLVDRVYGANYDVDPTKKMLSQAINIAQVSAIILLVFGEYILLALGIDMTMLRWALNNRIPSFFIVLFMGSLANSLTASGAFEIYFNGDLIFSKLEVDRWPTLLEVSNSIDEYGLVQSVST